MLSPYTDPYSRNYNTQNIVLQFLKLCATGTKEQYSNFIFLLTSEKQDVSITPSKLNIDYRKSQHIISESNNPSCLYSSWPVSCCLDRPLSTPNFLKMRMTFAHLQPSGPTYLLQKCSNMIGSGSSIISTIPSFSKRGCSSSGSLILNSFN